MKYTEFTKTVLRGIGQVMLQKNAVTGFIFLIGIFYASWLMGIGALIGVVVGTGTALLLKYKQKDIRAGLYGFNSTLVGIAFLFFFEPTIWLFIFLIIAVISSTIIMHFIYKDNLTTFTLPFVIVTWIFMNIIQILSIAPPRILQAQNFTAINILSGISMGFSQVLLQASVITGVLFFIAIILNSRISAGYALVGSTLGLLSGFLFYPHILNLANVGMMGYNGVLCGIVLSRNKKHSLIYATMAILVSIIIMYGFVVLNLPALTAPFILATGVTLLIKKKIQNWCNQY